MTERESTDRIIAENRKARFDYHLLEQFEAGMVLRGTEVKAIRETGINLRESYCRLENGEAYLLGAHIADYSHGISMTHDPVRPRKLLLHRTELNKLIGKTTERGLTIIPVDVHLKNGRVKITIALGKGKKMFDKRETIRRREADRETRAAVKSRRV